MDLTQQNPNQAPSRNWYMEPALIAAVVGAVVAGVIAAAISIGADRSMEKGFVDELKDALETSETEWKAKDDAQQKRITALEQQLAEVNKTLDEKTQHWETRLSSQERLLNLMEDKNKMTLASLEDRIQGLFGSAPASTPDPRTASSAHSIATSQAPQKSAPVKPAPVKPAQMAKPATKPKPEKPINTRTHGIDYHYEVEQPEYVDEATLLAGTEVIKVPDSRVPAGPSASKPAPKPKAAPAAHLPTPKTDPRLAGIFKDIKSQVNRIKKLTPDRNEACMLHFLVWWQHPMDDTTRDTVKMATEVKFKIEPGEIADYMAHKKYRNACSKESGPLDKAMTIFNNTVSPALDMADADQRKQLMDLQSALSRFVSEDYIVEKGEQAQVKLSANIDSMLKKLK